MKKASIIPFWGTKSMIAIQLKTKHINKTEQLSQKETKIPENKADAKEKKMHQTHE